MSAYVTVATEYKDGDALQAALRDAGWPVEVHAEAVTLNGYAGDQSRKAHLVLRKGAHADAPFEDMGFERKADGGHVGHLSTHLDKSRTDFIRQRYARHAIVQEAQRRGWRVTEQTQPGGAVKLTVARR